MAFPERIETERLILRRWEPADGDAYAAIWADRSVWASLRPGTTYNTGYASDRFAHHLRHWDEHGFGLLAIEEKESGEVCGWTGPAYPEFAPSIGHEIEVGWTLRAEFRGRGYATEAAAAAMEASLAHFDVPRVISVIEPGNERSQRIAARLNMERAGWTRAEPFGIDLQVYELRREGTTAAQG